MGLDITAYRHVWPAPDCAKGDDGYPEDYDSHFRVCNIVDFQDRAAPLTEGEDYGFEEVDGLPSRVLQRLRGVALAKLAGYMAHPGATRHAYSESAWVASAGPFWELIHFADNEGVIGSIAAAKLAADFAEFDGRAVRVEEPWFYELYRKWRQAFEMAADDGAVAFH